MLSRKITYKEVDRYLTKVVDSLLLKHGNVTNPAFETELESITGIGWKQVKNYKNHPNSSQVVAENSKVKEFIYRSRKGDRVYQAKQMIPLLLVALVVVYVGFRYSERKTGYLNVDRPIEPKSVQTSYPAWARFRVAEISTEFKIGANRSEYNSVDWDDCTAGSISTCNKRVFTESTGVSTVVSVQFRNDILSAISVATNLDSNKESLSRQIKLYAKEQNLTENAKGVYSNDSIEITHSSLEAGVEMFGVRVF